MRSITYALMAIVTAVLFNAHAFATMASWAEGNGWEIRGDSTSRFCQLNAWYEDEDMVSLLAGNINGGPAMGIQARNLRPLVEGMSVVEATLRFSNGNQHQLVARVLDPDLIFVTVPSRAVSEFALQNWMEIRVRGVLVGTYNLAGTHALVMELIRCVQAMNGEPS